VLIILGTLLVLAWRNAGWIGLDRWLLPMIGTPWQPGGVFRERGAT
jgi:thiosulfate dehydrogenase [quinone] large subunit